MHRRLSPLERVFWALGESLPVAVGLTARVSGPVRPDDQVAAAVAAVTARHAATRARVWHARLSTDGAPPVPVTADDLDTAMEQPFDAATGPLTRVLHTPAEGGFDLSVVCHHVVGDGFSLAYLLRDLVAELAGLGGGPDEVPAPTMDALIRAMPKPPRVPRIDQRGSTWPVRPGEVAGFRSMRWEIATGPLLARCRAEGTSVHAALGVAGLYALAELDGRTERQLYTPVNVRHLLPGLPDGAVGQYAVELFTWMDTAAGDFWTLARTLRERLTLQTAPERLLRQVRAVHHLRWLPAPVLGSLLAISAKPAGSFTLSNAGPLRFSPEFGDLRIETVHPFANMGTLTEGLLGAVTVDDRICLGLSTRQTQLAEADRFRQGFDAQLTAALA